MFCSHCGKEIADDSKFCEYCGSIQKITQPNERKKKPITRCLIIFIAVLMVIGGSIVTIAGIQHHLKKVAEEELKEKERLEQEAKEKAWKEAYCDFLIAVHSEDMDTIKERYSSMEEMLNQFFNNNYNSFGLDITDRRKATEEIKFSLIYLNDDDIPELLLTGDYCGVLLTCINGTVKPIAYEDNKSEIQFFDYTLSKFYYKEKNGLVLEDEWSTGDYLGVKVFHYNTDAKFVTIQDDIWYASDGASNENIGMRNEQKISIDETDTLIQEYKEQIQSEMKGKYAITKENLAKGLKFEAALTKDMDISKKSDKEILDIGKIFMEELDRASVREKIAEKVDIQYKTFNKEAAIRGYYKDVEVYEEIDGNCMYYKNVQLDSIQLLGLFPGIEVWKAGLLLEDEGFCYNGYWGLQDSSWDGRMTFCTGEEHGDWVARLLVEDEKVVDIEFFCIE